MMLSSKVIRMLGETEAEVFCFRCDIKRHTGAWTENYVDDDSFGVGYKNKLGEMQKVLAIPKVEVLEELENGGIKIDQRRGN